MARDIPKAKSASAVSDMESLTRNANTERIDEWGRFLEIVDQQKKTRGDDGRTQVWIDTKLKEQLEQMKANGLHFPIRYMLNAALQVFLEANKQEVDKYITK